MANTDIINATKEIVITMISNQTTEKSAEEVAKCMDIIYDELSKLIKDNPRVIYDKNLNDD